MALNAVVARTATKRDYQRPMTWSISCDRREVGSTGAEELADQRGAAIGQNGGVGIVVERDLFVIEREGVDRNRRRGCRLLSIVGAGCGQPRISEDEEVRGSIISRFDARKLRQVCACLALDGHDRFRGA